jgi:hypothetical protein
MSTPVLGSYSFSNTPDVNGNLVLVNNGSGALTSLTINTTPNPYDATTKAANNAYVQQVIDLTMATVPLANLTGGQYSFASLGSGCTVSYTVVAGAISSITAVVTPGTTYAVGDIIQVQAGNYDSFLAVASVSGTGVATLTILYGGTGHANASAVATLGAQSALFKYRLSGTLSSNVNLIMSNGTYLTQSNQWVISNNTTGAYTVTVFVSNGANAPIGTGQVIPQGINNLTNTWIETDGSTDVYLADRGGINIVLTAPGPIGSSTRGSGAFTFIGAGAASSASSLITFGAGTATVAPITLTTGTNLTTAVAGAIEYDGSVFYSTPASANRGVQISEQFCMLSSAYTLTSQTGVQKIFNSTTNGTITLPIGTYEFECQFSLSGMSVTSGSFGFALGGTFVGTQAWSAQAYKMSLNTAIDVATTAATWGNTFNTTANTSLTVSSTSATGWATIIGTIRVTTAGTVIPQVSLTTAAAAAVGTNSFFRIRQLGNGTVATVGNWS